MATGTNAATIWHTVVPTALGQLTLVRDRDALRGLYGDTVTYGGVADRLGGEVTAQQVGAAVGRNPLCIFLPCHRVLGATGALTGYAGGVARKRLLLDLEQTTRPTSMMPSVITDDLLVGSHGPDLRDVYPP